MCMPPKCSLYSMGGHIMPYHRCCSPCDVDYDVIGLTEDFGNDFKYITLKVRFATCSVRVRFFDSNHQKFEFNPLFSSPDSLFPTQLLVSESAGMWRTGSTVPAVHTSPRKFRTCNGLEVLFFYDPGIVRTCTEDLYR